MRLLPTPSAATGQLVPRFPAAHPAPALPAEWHFRSSLDRYIWIYGMICAFMHPKQVQAPPASPGRACPRRALLDQRELAMTLFGRLSASPAPARLPPPPQD